MFTAAVVVALLLAAALSWSAARKLSHDEQVVRSYAKAGVPENRLNQLAVVLFAGAAGLVVGLFWGPVGVAASIGLVCYFLAACAAHLRAEDRERLPTPLVLLALAVASLVLRASTL